VSRFQVLWAERAIEDLDEIMRHVAADSPVNSERLLARLRTRAATLTSSPRRGRIVPELAGFGMRSWRQLLVAPYRIVYRVSGRGVWVMAVIDSRRDLQDLLLERLLRNR
jgi:plasmid stabilization system protein ParE